MPSQVSGVQQVNAKLNKLAKQLNAAGAKAINKVARKAITNATKTVAKDVGVPVKTIRGRSRLMQKATSANPTARIRVNRMNMPAVRLFENSRNKMWVGRGGVVIGKYAIQRGFVQTLKNGRKHVMQRKGRKRYAIDVVKIPLAAKITTAYQKETADYPQEIRQALNKELGKML